MTNLITIPFRGDRLEYAVIDGRQFVPVKPICEALGLDRKTQQRKLDAAPRRWGGVILTLPSAGGEQEMFCIPAAKVFAWLASISPNKVKPELRERLELYQDEADQALADHFTGAIKREAAESLAALQRLREDLIARKPLWVKLRSYHAQGWDFEAMWRATGRSRREIETALADLARLGLIDCLPGGVPGAAQGSLFDAA